MEPPVSMTYSRRTGATRHTVGTALETVGHIVAFVVRSAHTLLTRGAPWRLSVEQIVAIGARSCVVVAVSGGFMGMVVALQFHETLVRFGAVGLLGSAVGLSLTRELAPVVTALMVIARAGSSVSAELGIMRAEQQVDALECMAIDPYRYLVLPRFIAFVVSLPLLFGIFTTVGIAGGYLVGVVGLGVGSGAFLEGLYATVLLDDLLMGFVKSLVFGILIGAICTAKGFLIQHGPYADDGASGVSRTTTNAVVLAALTTLFADYVIGAALA
jgi:phospholipid/cholesterol/gamma-HCH transport system permease protein